MTEMYVPAIASFALDSASPAGSFSAYVAWAQSIPNLSEEEERRLLEEFAETHHLPSAQKIVLSYLKYVISIAHSYVRYGLPIQDLVQEGNIGLMKAIKRFDLSYSVRFSTLATYWIKSEIREYIIRNWRMVKIATTKAQRKLFSCLRKNFDHAETVSENLKRISEDAGVSLEETRHMYNRMMQPDASLEAPLYASEDAPSLGDSLSLVETPLQRLLQEEYEVGHEWLIKALASLPERERWLIETRWLGSEETKPTLTELSKVLGVSVERARQIEVKAMKQLKLVLQDKGLVV